MLKQVGALAKAGAAPRASASVCRYVVCGSVGSDKLCLSSLCFGSHKLCLYNNFSQLILKSRNLICCLLADKSRARGDIKRGVGMVRDYDVISCCNKRKTGSMGLAQGVLVLR